MSRLILLPVPGTTPTGAPVLRVVVVPELDAAASVAASPLADWPSRLGEASFEVGIDIATPAGTAAPRPLTVQPVHEADSEVWSSFFAALPVVSVPTPDIGAAPTVTPTAEQAAAVEATYVAAANAPLTPGAAAPRAFQETVATELTTNWSADETEEPVPPTAPPVTTRGVIDFHQVLSMLREHPAVLRNLGLVFELPLPSQLGSTGTLRVRWPDRPSDLPEVASPRAAYEVDEDRGLLAASTRLVKAGVLDLGDTATFATTTLDVDGAVGRLQDAARGVAAAARGDGRGNAGREGSAAQQPVTLPALRSAGIVLMRNGHAADLEDRRSRAKAANEADSLDEAEPLHAEDLMIGLRLDVRRRGADIWTSLNRREATYLVGGRELAAPSEEEGHIKFGAAVRQDDGVLRADEIVARWTGWSLAAPPARPDRRGGAPERAALPFDFDWTFEVPRGSLLPLRFGTSYHVRARVADLAGGGVPPEDRDATHGTPAVTYVRHEPVMPPTVTIAEGLDPADLGPGGSVDHLVVRSDAPDYPRNDARGLAAPRTTLEVAEQHGMLDGSDTATFEHVLRALDAGLPDPAAEGVTVFPVPEPGGVTARTEQPGWAGEWPDAANKTLSLEAVDEPADQPVRLDPTGAVVRVRLTPAEQLTLALSSFLKDGFDSHLAVRQWRTGSPDDGDPVLNGRHPMSSPSHDLTLVHAVRRPLAVPSGALTPQRQVDGTSAVLEPSTPMLGVNVNSTVQLQVTAAWTEFDDVTRTEMTGVKVQDVAIDRGDEVLGATLVHELGDSRHRQVAYTLTAVSRFRHLYRPDEDPELFVTSIELPAVNVPNTARPAPPAVHATVPAFAGTSESDGSLLRHRRRGGLLRVELSRPWFLSGEGEQLGVVVQQCEIGRDPVWSTPSLADRVPAPADFDGTPVSITHPEAGPVTVVGFDTVFAGGRWVADVGLPGLAATSYRPFVRLAVTRYQPSSLDDAHAVSTVVRTDLVQLMPDRTLTVDTSGGDLVVTLEGLGPEGPVSNRVDVIVETLPVESEVEVSVLGATTDGLVAWTAAGGPVSGPLNTAITVPRAAGAKVRLRVREVEEALTLAGAAAAAGELAERVVFTDLVGLP
jgi:hypothetical protein